MQWVSRADFVAPVCNAGGIGFITAESFETPEDLRSEIRKMRGLTDKPFGVNISMVPEFGVPERSLKFCEVVAEEGVKVVETAGRSPKPLMPVLKDAGITVIHKMTSIRHAESAQKLGVDAVTLIGYGSGGHIGMDNVASFIMIPMAVSRLDIPVIAGGGVADGKGFLGALAMGAEAVLMGTAFFATQECPAHDAIKERLVQTRENETCLILNSLHNPIRCVKNKLADQCLLLEENNASFEEIINAVAGGKGKLAYDSGDTEISPIACGQIVGAIDRIKTVKQVIDDIINEAGVLMKRLNAMTA
jgi:nitronate monooxygenase